MNYPILFMLDVNKMLIPRFSILTIITYQKLNNGSIFHFSLTIHLRIKRSISLQPSIHLIPKTCPKVS